MARILYDIHEYDWSKRLYKLSLQVSKELGDQSGMASSLHELAIIQQDKENYEEAERLYRKSLEIFEKLGDKSGIAMTFGALGRLSEILERPDEMSNRHVYITLITRQWC